MGTGPTVSSPTLTDPAAEERTGFSVHLEVFEGPFDLLLSLIAKHKLDVTEVALSQVTDEFIAYIKGVEWDLDEASEFLVVAATLLDLKTARLLPSGEVEDEDDLALLEARDLLFARLLQYKAYKEVAAFFAARIDQESLHFPRAVGLEERYAGLLPEVVVGLGPHELAALAAKAVTPKPVPVVGLTHLHQPQVSVREQAALLVERLRRSRQVTFRALAADCPSTLHVVARFLALLELYRERVVAFEQLTPLGELTIRWSGDDDDDRPVEVGAEFDEAELVPAAGPSDGVAPAGVAPDQEGRNV
ncbi:MAG TPA: segregation/condensation protein A [Jiangellaceae bacterium]